MALISSFTQSDVVVIATGSWAEARQCPMPLESACAELTKQVIETARVGHRIVVDNDVCCFPDPRVGS
jgi:hypothetical protein